MSLSVAVPASGAVVADSVADFGGVQGAGGWTYGYVAPTTSPSFVPFPKFGPHSGSPAAGDEPAWFVSYSGEPILFPTPYTHLTASGGHTNGGSGSVAVEHWTVRRWTAPFAAVFTFSGVMGDYTPDFGGGGDGVLAEAVVGGAAVWTRNTTRTTPDSPYSFDAALAAGRSIDFVVKPKANEDTDYYTWTIQVVPAPAAGAAFVCGTLAVTARRRGPDL